MNETQIPSTGNAGNDAAIAFLHSNSQGLSQVTLQQLLSNDQFISALGRSMMARRDYDEKMSAFRQANEKLILDQQQLAELQSSQGSNLEAIKSQLRQELETEWTQKLSQQVQQTESQAYQKFYPQIAQQVTQQLQARFQQQLQQAQTQTSSANATFAQVNNTVAKLISGIKGAIADMEREGLDALAEDIIANLKGLAETKVDSPTNVQASNQPQLNSNGNGNGAKPMNGNNLVEGQIYAQPNGQQLIVQNGMLVPYNPMGMQPPTPQPNGQSFYQPPAPSQGAWQPQPQPNYPFQNPTPQPTQPNNGGMTPTQQAQLSAIMTTIASRHSDYQMRISRISDMTKRPQLTWLDMDSLLTVASASGKTLVQQYEETYNIKAVDQALADWDAQVQAQQNALLEQQRQQAVDAEVTKRVQEALAGAGAVDPMAPNVRRGNPSPLQAALNRGNAANNLGQLGGHNTAQPTGQNGQPNSPAPAPVNPNQPPPIPLDPYAASEARVANAARLYNEGTFDGKVFD